MYWKYVIRRLIYAFLIYAVIVFIFSAIFNTVADNVLRAQITEQVNGEMRAYTRAGTTAQLDRDAILAMKERRLAELLTRNHLDEPLVSRIFWRTLDTLRFNLGQATQMRSFAGDTAVAVIVGERIPRTLLLFATATVINIILGVWLGMRKARKAGGLMDKTTSIGTMVVYGMPAWWLGMLLIMLFAFTIPILPSGGMHATPPPEGIGYTLDLLYHMVLPVMTLVILGFWGTAYITRNIVLGTLQEDFVMSARARGISERRVLFGHTLRSAAPPIVTLSVLGLLASIFGAIIYEGIFNWPGMGMLYWAAVQQSDIPVLMGNLSMTTGLYIVGLAFLDLIYGFLDPRVKVGGRA